MKTVRRRSYRNYTDNDLREAVRASVSIAGVLRKLGLVPAGGNYHNIHILVQGLGLNTSHWTGQGHRKGSHSPVASNPIEKLLVRGRMVNSNHLKIRLIKEGYMKDECSECKLHEWRGKPLVLHLDHRSGDRSDNTLENLRLLCPNCHSQTKTYCGRNVGAGSKLRTSTRLNDFKLKVVTHAGTFGFKSASKKYDVHPDTVSKWFKRQHGGMADTPVLKIGDLES